MAPAKSTAWARALLTPGVVVQCPRSSRAALSSSRSTALWTGYTGFPGSPPTSRNSGKGLPWSPWHRQGTAWPSSGRLILQGTVSEPWCHCAVMFHFCSFSLQEPCGAAGVSPCCLGLLAYQQFIGNVQRIRAWVWWVALLGCTGKGQECILVRSCSLHSKLPLSFHEAVFPLLFGVGCSVVELWFSEWMWLIPPLLHGLAEAARGCLPWAEYLFCTSCPLAQWAGLSWYSDCSNPWMDGWMGLFWFRLNLFLIPASPILKIWSQGFDMQDPKALTGAVTE